MDECLIGKYKLTRALIGQNSGYARWGFAAYNGREYFIKEFISPVYPDPSSPISDEMRAALVADCLNFETRKNRLYSAINASSNGNIIGIREFFRWKSRYYIVTDKVEPESTNINEIAALPLEKKLLLLRVLLYNIKCIHDRSVIHADLKPDNLILKATRNGFFTVKLIDFDSSFFEDDPPVNTDEIQGDMCYLAPETYLRIIGRDIKLTTKADIFALGVIFHEFLCGFRPVLPEGYDYIYETALDGAKVKLYNRLPPKIAALIRKMLSPNPADRPSASEIFYIFGDSHGGEPAPETLHFSRTDTLG